MSAARTALEAELAAACFSTTAESELIQNLNNQIDLACEDLLEKNTVIREQEALITSRDAQVQELAAAQEGLLASVEEKDRIIGQQIGTIQDLKSALATHSVQDKVRSSHLLSHLL